MECRISKKKIFIHIGVDEKFYAPARIQFSEITSITNIYFLMSKKNINIENVIVVKDFRTFFEEISKIDYFALVLHSRCGIPESYFRKIPKEKKVIWISFGFDLYRDTSFFPFGQKLPLKYPLFKKKTIHYLWLHPYKYICCRLGSIWKHRLGYSYFLRRVDYLSTRLNVEYELFSSIYSRVRNFHFYYVSNLRISNPTNLSDSKLILVGNSASVGNNHFDILETLKERKIEKEYNLLLPLNYGDKLYGEAVLKSAVRYFGTDRVTALESFIPINDYMKLLNSCRVGIMGHMRQQALGNIRLMLLNGAKIFMYKDSIVYKYYTSIGIKLYTIEDDLNLCNINELLPANVIKKNREVLLGRSYKKCLEILNRSVNTVIQEKS